jgi:short-subunit dehydrogenase
MKNLNEYGKWALVTGGSSGIGKSIVRKLCEDRVNCVIVSDNSQDLISVSENYKEKYEIEIKTVCCDMSKVGFIDEIKQVTKGIQIDILVNCASFGILSDFYKTSKEKYLTCINLSITAYFLLTYEFLEGMKKRNNGAIINVSSVNAFQAVGYSSVYTASKAFELNFSNSIWKELEKTGIDVLCIMPGGIQTKFQSKAGTQVAKWAKNADEVIPNALKKLGKHPVAIIGGWRCNAYYWITKILPIRFGIKFATWSINSNLRK